MNKNTKVENQIKELEKYKLLIEQSSNANLYLILDTAKMMNKMEYYNIIDKIKLTEQLEVEARAFKLKILNIDILEDTIKILSED